MPGSTFLLTQVWLLTVGGWCPECFHLFIGQLGMRWNRSPGLLFPRVLVQPLPSSPLSALPIPLPVWLEMGWLCPLCSVRLQLQVRSLMLWPKSQGGRSRQLLDHSWVLFAAHSTFVNTIWMPLLEGHCSKAYPSPHHSLFLWLELFSLSPWSVSHFLFPLVLAFDPAHWCSGAAQTELMGAQGWVNHCGRLDCSAPSSLPPGTTSSNVAIPRQGTQMPFQCLCDSYHLYTLTCIYQQYTYSLPSVYIDFWLCLEKMDRKK